MSSAEDNGRNKHRGKGADNSYERSLPSRHNYDGVQMPGERKSKVTETVRNVAHPERSSVKNTSGLLRNSSPQKNTLSNPMADLRITSPEKHKVSNKTHSRQPSQEMHKMLDTTAKSTNDSLEKKEMSNTKGTSRKASPHRYVVSSNKVDQSKNDRNHLPNSIKPDTPDQVANALKNKTVRPKYSKHAHTTQIDEMSNKTDGSRKAPTRMNKKSNSRSPSPQKAELSKDIADHGKDSRNYLPPSPDTPGEPQKSWKHTWKHGQHPSGSTSPEKCLEPALVSTGKNEESKRKASKSQIAKRTLSPSSPTHTKNKMKKDGKIVQSPINETGHSLQSPRVAQPQTNKDNVIVTKDLTKSKKKYLSPSLLPKEDGLEGPQYDRGKVTKNNPVRSISHENLQNTNSVTRNDGRHSQTSQKQRTPSYQHDTPTKDSIYRLNKSNISPTKAPKETKGVIYPSNDSPKECRDKLSTKSISQGKDHGKGKYVFDTPNHLQEDNRDKLSCANVYPREAQNEIDVATEPTKDPESKVKSVIFNTSLVETIQKENIHASTGFLSSEMAKREEQVRKIQELAKSVLDNNSTACPSASKSSTSITEMSSTSSNIKIDSPSKNKRSKSNESLKARSASEPRKRKSKDNKIIYGADSPPTRNENKSVKSSQKAIINDGDNIERHNEKRRKHKKKQVPKVRSGDQLSSVLSSDTLNSEKNHEVKSAMSVSKSNDSESTSTRSANENVQVVSSPTVQNEVLQGNEKSPPVTKSQENIPQAYHPTLLDSTYISKSGGDQTPGLDKSLSPPQNTAQDNKEVRKSRRSPKRHLALDQKITSLPDRQIQGMSNSGPAVILPSIVDAFDMLMSTDKSFNDPSKKESTNTDSASRKPIPPVRRSKSYKLKSLTSPERSPNFESFALSSSNISLMEESLSPQVKLSCVTREVKSETGNTASSQDANHVLQQNTMDGENLQLRHSQDQLETDQIRGRSPLSSKLDKDPPLEKITAGQLKTLSNDDQDEAIKNNSLGDNVTDLWINIEDEPMSVMNLVGHRLDLGSKDTKDKSPIVSDCGCSDYACYKMARQDSELFKISRPNCSTNGSKYNSEVCITPIPDNTKNAAQPFSIRVVGTDPREVSNTGKSCMKEEFPKEKGGKKEKDCKKKKKGKGKSTESCLRTEKKRRSRSEESVCQKSSRNECAPRCDDRHCPGRGGSGRSKSSCRSGDFSHIQSWFGRFSAGFGCQLSHIACHRSRPIPHTGFYHPDNTTLGWIENLPESCSDTTTATITERDETEKRTQDKDDDDTDSQVKTIPRDESKKERKQQSQKRDEQKEKKAKSIDSRKNTGPTDAIEQTAEDESNNKRKQQSQKLDEQKEKKAKSIDSRKNTGPTDAIEQTAEDEEIESIASVKSRQLQESKVQEPENGQETPIWTPTPSTVCPSECSGPLSRATRVSSSNYSRGRESEKDLASEYFRKMSESRDTQKRYRAHSVTGSQNGVPPIPVRRSKDCCQKDSSKQFRYPSQPKDSAKQVCVPPTQVNKKHPEYISSRSECGTINQSDQTSVKHETRKERPCKPITIQPSRKPHETCTAYSRTPCSSLDPISQQEPCLDYANVADSRFSTPSRTFTTPTNCEEGERNKICYASGTKLDNGSRVSPRERAYYRPHSADNSMKSYDDDISPTRKSNYLRKLEQGEKQATEMQKHPSYCEQPRSSETEKGRWLESMMNACRRGQAASNSRRGIKESSANKHCRQMRDDRDDSKCYKRSASFSRFSSHNSQLDNSERSRQGSKMSCCSSRSKYDTVTHGSESMTSTDNAELSNGASSRWSTESTGNNGDQSRTRSASSRGEQSCVTESESETTLTCPDHVSSSTSCHSEDSETERCDQSHDSGEECTSDGLDAGDSTSKHSRSKVKRRIIIKNPEKLKNTEIRFNNMKLRIESSNYDDDSTIMSSNAKPLRVDCKRYLGRDKTSNRRRNPDTDSEKATSVSQQSFMHHDMKHCNTILYDSTSREQDERILAPSKKVIDLPSASDISNLASSLGVFPLQHIDRLRRKILPEQKIDCFQQIITPEQPTSICGGETNAVMMGYFEDDNCAQSINRKESTFYTGDVATSMTASQIQTEYDEVYNFGKSLLDKDMVYMSKPVPKSNTELLPQADSSIFDTEYDDITSCQSIAVWSKDKNASSSGNNNQSSSVDQEECNHGHVYYSKGIKHAIKTFNANLLALSKDDWTNETVHLDNMKFIPNKVQRQMEMRPIGEFSDQSFLDSKDDPMLETIRSNRFNALICATGMTNISSNKSVNVIGNGFTSNQVLSESDSQTDSKCIDNKSTDMSLSTSEKQDVGIQVKISKPLSDLTITSCEIYSHDAEHDTHFSFNSSKHKTINELKSKSGSNSGNTSNLNDAIESNIESSVKVHQEKPLKSKVTLTTQSLLSEGVSPPMQANCNENDIESEVSSTYQPTQSITDIHDFRHEENIANTQFESLEDCHPSPPVDGLIELLATDSACDDSVSSCDKSLENSFTVEFTPDDLASETFNYKKPGICANLPFAGDMLPPNDTNKDPVPNKTRSVRNSRLRRRHSKPYSSDMLTEAKFNPLTFVRQCLEKEIEKALDGVYKEVLNSISDYSLKHQQNVACSNNAAPSSTFSCCISTTEEMESAKEQDHQSLLDWVKTRLSQEIGKLVSRFDWSAISEENTCARKSSFRGSSVDFCNNGKFACQVPKIHFSNCQHFMDTSVDPPYRETVGDQKSIEFKPTYRHLKRNYKRHQQQRKGGCNLYSCSLSDQTDKSFEKILNETMSHKQNRPASHKCSMFAPGVENVNGPIKTKNTSNSTSVDKNHPTSKCDLEEACYPKTLNNTGSKCSALCEDMMINSRYDESETSRNLRGKSSSQTILNYSHTEAVSPMNCHSVGSLTQSRRKSSYHVSKHQCAPAYQDGFRRRSVAEKAPFKSFVLSSRSDNLESSSSFTKNQEFRSAFLRSGKPDVDSRQTGIYCSMLDPAEAFVRKYLSVPSTFQSRRIQQSRLHKTSNSKIFFSRRANSEWNFNESQNNGQKEISSRHESIDKKCGDVFESSEYDIGNSGLYYKTDCSRLHGKTISNDWIESLLDKKDDSHRTQQPSTGASGRSYSNRNFNQSANSDSSPHESLSDSSGDCDVINVPYINKCLSEGASHRGINRSEAVLDLPSLCRKELIAKTNERLSFLSTMQRWKNREGKYQEPHSEPIYQTCHYRRRDNDVSDFARKNLNGSGNIIHSLSKNDLLVNEDCEDNVDGSEEDFHSAEEDMTSYPSRLSEMDRQKPRYLCPHHMTDVCNHRQFSLVDECNRLQLQDVCRNCPCLMKYCHGIKRDLKSHYCKAPTNLYETMNTTSQAMCFSNNRSEQEDRSIVFPLYGTLSEKCKGKPKIFKMGGGFGTKSMPNTIKDFVNWYACDEQNVPNDPTSLVVNDEEISQYLRYSKADRSEKCQDISKSKETSKVAKEDPTAHGDVQNINFKPDNKSTITTCEMDIEKANNDVMDESSSSYEDTEDDDNDDDDIADDDDDYEHNGEFRSIEHLGYRMLKGVVDPQLYEDKQRVVKKSKAHNTYRETFRKSRAPLRKRVCNVKRSRGINKFHPTENDSFRGDKTHKVYHRGESHGDVSDSTSLEDIQVPKVDKARVRFACDKNGEWAEVGRGSYGCVYLGLLDGKIEVAIKDFYESNSYEHVIHEARMLVYLQGTGITPKFYGLRRRFDTTKQPGEYCIIMEYFGDGKTLFNVLSEKIELTINEWLDVLGQLVAGLRLIHRRNVLINDLKADNILIDLNSARKTIRYIDVGMATYKQGLTFQLPQNQMGKYNFLAPEVRGGLHTSKRSDIYSLGYMLDQIRRVAGDSLGGLEILVTHCMREEPKMRPYIDEIVAKVHKLVKSSDHTSVLSDKNCILLSNSV